MLKRSVYISINQPLRVPIAALFKAAPLQGNTAGDAPGFPCYSSAQLSCALQHHRSPSASLLMTVLCFMTSLRCHTPTDSLPPNFMPPTGDTSCPRNPSAHESLEVALLGPVRVSQILSLCSRLARSITQPSPSIPAGHGHPAHLKLPVLSTKVSPGRMPPKTPPA